MAISIIKPPSGPAAYRYLKTLWHYRVLVRDLVARDMRLRYLGASLGTYWTLLHPLAMITIYALIFGRLFHVRFEDQAFTHPLAYTLYLCAGMLPWTAFNEALSRLTSVFADNAHLVKRVQFPTALLTITPVGTSVLTLTTAMALYAGLLVMSGHGLGSPFWCFPFILLLQAMLTTGLGLSLAVTNVFFRDTRELLPIVLQVWFWATPLVYTLERLPAPYRPLFWLNPFYGISRLYQDAFFFQRWPSPHVWLASLLSASTAFLLGSLLFERTRANIPDEL